MAYHHPCSLNCLAPSDGMAASKSGDDFQQALRRLRTLRLSHRPRRHRHQSGKRRETPYRGCQRRKNAAALRFSSQTAVPSPFFQSTQRQTRSGHPRGLLYHALRRGELCAAHMGDYAPRRGVASLDIHGKGSRIRHLPVDQSASSLIEKFHDFAGHRGDSKDALFRPERYPRGTINKRHLIGIANRKLKANNQSERAMIGGVLVVALHTNEQFQSRSRCCPGCSQRRIKIPGPEGQEQEATQYYHRQVYAQITEPDFCVNLNLEPIGQGEEEARATFRLLGRMRRVYGARFWDVVTVDARYATEAFLRVVEKSGYGLADQSPHQCAPCPGCLSDRPPALGHRESSLKRTDPALRPGTLCPARIDRRSGVSVIPDGGPLTHRQTPRQDGAPRPSDPPGHSQKPHARPGPLGGTVTAQERLIPLDGPANYLDPWFGLCHSENRPTLTQGEVPPRPGHQACGHSCAHRPAPKNLTPSPASPKSITPSGIPVVEGA